MSGWSRREFLKAAAAGGAAAGVGLPATAAQDSSPAILGPGKVPVTLTVNGRKHELSLEPRTTLLNALRNHLDVTGCKEVCDRGACGACTLLLDGKPVVSCLVLAIDAAGKEIRTVEGLAQGDKLDPLQQKFIEKEGLQCGFCIPGFLVSIRSALDANPKASLDEIKRGCAGNVCRCAAYPGMFAAAVAVVKGEKPEPDLSKLGGEELKKVLEERGVPRVDGPDKVRGAAKYTHDVKLPGMLHLKVLHNPFASAVVEGSPDVEAAKNVPGVRHVEILRKESKSIGEEIAVVIAEDPQAAEEGLSALRLRLRAREGSFDVAETFEKGRAKEDDASADMRRRLEKAAAVAENTYFVNVVQHSALEPHGVVAHHAGDSATVYESTQHVTGTHDVFVKASGLGRGSVRAVCEYAGGGFGCKIRPWEFGPRVLRYSKDLGAPVKAMQSRAGELLQGGGRVPNVVKVALGADRSGKLVADHRRVLGRVDAYWYDVPSAADQVRARIDWVGPAPALRAPGDPPRQFVMESILDDVAHKLDADPLEIRLKNSQQASPMKRWFEEGAKRIGWERRKKAGSDSGPRPRGFGVGCGAFAGSSGCAFVEVEVDRGTGVVRVVKAVAILQGGFVNRRAVVNQVEGGTIMSLSWALTEERIVDGKTGAMLNPNFEFYKILGPLDVPEVEVVLFGEAGRATGVGEAPVVPVPGALSNAIFNALGVRVTRMPFTPRNVLAALGKAGR